MRRLINAFAIELAVPFVLLWVHVPVYVSLQFFVSFRTIKKVCFLFFKFQLIATNKNMKKWQTPQEVYNKDVDQTVPPHNLIPAFI